MLTSMARQTEAREGPTTDSKWGVLRQQGLASGIPPTNRKWATVALPIVCTRCVCFIARIFQIHTQVLKNLTSNPHSNELNANQMGISSGYFCYVALKLYTWRQYRLSVRKWLPVHYSKSEMWFTSRKNSTIMTCILTNIRPETRADPYETRFSSSLFKSHMTGSFGNEGCLHSRVITMSWLKRRSCVHIRIV